MILNKNHFYFLFLGFSLGCSTPQAPSSRSIASIQHSESIFDLKSPAEVGFLFTALQLYSELSHSGHIQSNEPAPVCLNRPELGNHPEIEVAMKTDGSFRLGQAILNPKQEQVFVHVASIALNNTYRFMKSCWKTEKFQTEITGFADGVPLKRPGKSSLEANQELALERACVLAVVLTDGRSFKDYDRCLNLLGQRSLRPRKISTDLLPEISQQLSVSSFVDPLWIENKINSADLRKVTLKVSSVSLLSTEKNGNSNTIEPTIKIAQDESQLLFQEAARKSALKLIQTYSGSVVSALQNLDPACQSNTRVRRALEILANNPSAKIDPSDFFCFDVSEVFYELFHKHHADLIEVKPNPSSKMRVNPSTLQSHGKHHHRGFYCAYCGSGSRYDYRKDQFKIEPRWITQDPTHASASRSAFVAYLIKTYFDSNPELDFTNRNSLIDELSPSLDRLIFQKASQLQQTSYWPLNRYADGEAQNLLTEIQDQLQTLLIPEESDDRRRSRGRTRRQKFEWREATASDLWKLQSQLKNLSGLPEKWIEHWNALQKGEKAKKELELISDQNHLSYAAQMRPQSWVIPLSCKEFSKLSRSEFNNQLTTLRPIPLSSKGVELPFASQTRCLITFPVAQACGADPSGFSEGSWSKEFKESIACATGIDPSQVPDLKDFSEFIRSINRLRSSEASMIRTPLMEFSESDAKTAIEKMTCSAISSSP